MKLHSFKEEVLFHCFFSVKKNKKGFFFLTSLTHNLIYIFYILCDKSITVFRGGARITCGLCRGSRPKTQQWTGNDGLYLGL